MRIAIIGGGISGLVCAHRLQREHEITLYEANDYAGGHTHTHHVDIDDNGRDLAVDTGFIVFNRQNYPHFSRLLDELGVAAQPTSMSFSVHCERTGLEYNGTSVNRLFAQRRNLWRSSFLRMVRDILRFNRESPRLLERDATDVTVNEYVQSNGYSTTFRNYYLIPMCAALWSAPPRMVENFSIGFLVRFFHNHGMLAVNGRPQWLVVRGGSATYVRALLDRFSGRLLLNTPVRELRRHAAGVRIQTDSAEQDFDQVILACHSDQALQLLADADTVERGILGAMRYQDNEAVLHTDGNLLPRRRLARASWNYRIPATEPDSVAVTYHMNSLQGLQSRQPICVTLNQTESIRSEKVIKRLRYAHPLFTTEAVAAQRRWPEISGINRTHFCGAYWGQGFHEDGVRSALAVCKQLGASHRDA